MKDTPAGEGSRSLTGRALNWIRSRSLWYYPVTGGCCADELIACDGARYDLERFGCLLQTDPSKADLLVISGAFSYKAIDSIQQVFQRLASPKYVMVLGSCASGGGLFHPEKSYVTLPGVDRVIPVDVYVPGCPPRPEAIMFGIKKLQDRICGHERLDLKD